MQYPPLEELQNRVRVNKKLIVLLVSFAFSIGAVPAFVALGRLSYFFIGIPLVLVSTIFVARRLEHSATYSPSWFEFFLAGVGGIFPMTNLGIGLLFFYTIMRGLIWLILFVAGWFGTAWDWDADSISFFTSLVIIMSATIGYANYTAKKMASQLYPATTGLRSAFYKIRLKPRRFVLQAITFVMFIAIGYIMFSVNNISEVVFWAGLQLLLMFATTSLFTASAEKVTKESADIISNLKNLFEDIGYQVELFPRLGNKSVDPLLATVDIFAQREDHSLLIDVMEAAGEEKLIDWTKASSLRQAAWAFSQERGLESQPEIRLILVDSKPDASLKKYNREVEGIQITRLTNSIIKQLLNKEDEKRFYTIQKILNLSTKGEP